MKAHIYYVYILTTSHNKVLYTGVTNYLERRCREHSDKLIKGFTSRYNIDKLVYFEVFDNIEIAIARQKQIKAYSRKKKEALINYLNKDWSTLYINGKIKYPIKHNRNVD